jgi:hypothetical protein
MITDLSRVHNFDRDDPAVLHEKSIKRCVGIPTVAGYSDALHLDDGLNDSFELVKSEFVYQHS